MAGEIFVLAIVLSTGTIAFSSATNEDDRLSMCEGARNLVFDRMLDNQGVFSTWINEMQALPVNDERYTHYFYDKPVDSELSYTRASHSAVYLLIYKRPEVIRHHCTQITIYTSTRS